MIDGAEVAKVLAELDPAERAGGLRLIQAYAQGGRKLAHVAEAMIHPSTVVPAAEALQAQANAELRVRFLEDHGTYASEDLARLAGSRADNAAQHASRLKRQGRCFSVRWAGRVLYPRFQFTEDGRPYPAVAEVLRVFRGQLTEWQVAFWFVSGNGLLDDRAPVDLLGQQPAAVLEAARAEVAFVA
jgi:hypothetical protein